MGFVDIALRWSLSFVITSGVTRVLSIGENLGEGGPLTTVGATSQHRKKLRNYSESRFRGCLAKKWKHPETRKKQELAENQNNAEYQNVVS